MTRPSFPDEIVAVVDLCDLFVTVNPRMSLVAAVDVICDLEGIVDDRDRRAIRRLLERRLHEQGVLLPELRAA